MFAITAMALKARRQRLVGGDSELIGAQVRVHDVNAAQPTTGWVSLQGENWQVHSATPLQAGQQVRVLARHGLRLDVAALEQSTHEEVNHGS